MFLINNTNKLVQLRKGGTTGKNEEVKECNFVNVNNLSNRKQSSLLVSDNLKQQILVPINH